MQIATMLHLSKDTVNKYVNEYDEKRDKLLRTHPDMLVGKVVDVRLYTDKVVIYHDGTIVAQHKIQEYCSLLRLNAISEHFEKAIKNAIDYEGFLHQLLRMEVDAEEERSKERKIKAAKFPYRKYSEDLELDILPEAMRKRLPELCSLDFIRESKNIIMTGNPGTGKTYTAIGLGIKACEQGYRVLYTTIPYLVTELKESNSQQ